MTVENPKNPPRLLTKEEQKQQIVDDIKKLLKTVTQILKVHNDNNWDETAQGYNLSGKDQLFDVIYHEFAANKFAEYNKNDDESRAARREVYLAFEYNKDYINAFGTLVNRLAESVRDGSPYSYYISHGLEGIVNGIREYAKAYYLQAFNKINNKKDELKKLSLNKLKILLNKINTIKDAKTNIVNAAHKIKEDYDKDIPTGRIGRLRTYTFDRNLQRYLNRKLDKVAKDLKIIKKTANTIMNILIST
ncbi:virulence associated lipoprotein (plasmid) [Borrelia puertoricensis]|uniref:virulence associated lipoprotein n=1 Tax=Borrelia puertoricensis TaxID=2756107 RepID=UPI001FF461DE|nr:virulence associated lipoprotein [Borrelia puertoricensis]UPA18940.1 hypothetical protein bpuSUM_001478 [Borrelia puertoricensis]